MRLFYFIYLPAAILCACSSPTEVADAGNSVSSIIASMPDSTIPPADQEIPGIDSLNADPVYTYETFMPEGDKGWGYRILMDGQLYIEQPHIPAVQGNRLFSSPIDAIKTAELAISKIKQGLVPPTITVEELDSLGVLD